MKKHYLVFFGILYLFYACNEDIREPYLSDQANRLLSLESNKDWFLKSRKENGSSVVLGECEQSAKLRFEFSSSDSILFIVNKIVGCSSSQDPDTLLKANYELKEGVNEVFLDELILSNVQGLDVETIAIKHLTSKELVISYQTESVTIEEAYSYTANRILLVSEVNEMLSKFGTKVWSRTRSYDGESTLKLDTCVNSLNLVFKNGDDDVLYFVEQVAYCESNIRPDTVFSSLYYLSSNENAEFTGGIILVDNNGNDQGSLGVASISEESLELVYSLNGVGLEETYSYNENAPLKVVEVEEIISAFNKNIWELTEKKVDKDDVELAPCMDDVEISFDYLNDSEFSRRSQVANCETGILPDTLISAQYYFSRKENGDFTDTLYLIENSVDTLFYLLEDVSSKSIKLKSEEGDEEVEEYFEKIQ